MNVPAAPEPVLTESLLRLAGWLQAQGYGFTTVTPATHARVNARPGTETARSLRDVFGWSRPFAPSLLPAEPLECLRAAQLLEPDAAGRLRSRVRFSTLEGQLFAHSAYPTTAEDAVFFGPDTYRFVQLVTQELQREPLPAGGVILDVGCGAGPGGVMAARAAAAQQPQLVLSDINAQALRFAAANAAHAGWGAAKLAQGDLYGAVDGSFDLIVANPPYLNDSQQRAYRHGGGRWGEALSARIVREGLPRLAPGGRLVLYTGVAMVDGEDPLLEGLRVCLGEHGWPWNYRELDPDVFGEELEEAAYAQAERIAAIALVVRRPA
jgi:methylase of polypeptide subunit release factors